MPRYYAHGVITMRGNPLITLRRALARRKRIKRAFSRRTLCDEKRHGAPLRAPLRLLRRLHAAQQIQNPSDCIQRVFYDPAIVGFSVHNALSPRGNGAGGVGGVGGGARGFQRTANPTWDNAAARLTAAAPFRVGADLANITIA